MKHAGALGLMIAMAAVLAPHAAANSRGGPARTSGGPFPGERDCTRCHSGEVNSGPGALSLTVGGVPAAGTAAPTYSPGQTVALIVSFQDSTKFRVGFQLTARSGGGCGQPGSLAAAASPDGAGIKAVTGSCGSGPEAGQVQWVTHRNPRNGSSATFAVDWTAPDADVGPVTIAVAVNGADGSQNTRDDNIYTLQATLQPSAVTMPAAPAGPVISDGGVTALGDSDPPLTTGAPGGIAVISGSGFAGMGAADGGALSARPSGVCVEVNQVRAPVLSADDTTAFVQIPPETALGPAAVQVIRNCDPGPEAPQELRSNVAMFEIASAQPVLLQLSESLPSVSAVRGDFSLVAQQPATDASPGAGSPGPEMPPGTAAGMPADTDLASVGSMMSPALPGDVVTFFGTGFGLTEPVLAAGEIPALPSVLADAGIGLMLGQTMVPQDHIVYAGATPGVAGLYQLSARIPDAMPAGEFAVSVMAGMQSSPPGPMIAIGIPSVEVESGACQVGLVLEAGESCSGSLATYTGTFYVACQDVGGHPFGRGLLVAEKQADNTWKITKFGG
ncbi:MAG: hypothetical protein OXD30_11630 [Bryobacterales bacterium]|nr:hypothetical protein [Bryobacterales bacterium]